MPGNAKPNSTESTSVLPRQGLRAFTLGGERSKVDLSFVGVADQPFHQALRADVKETTENPWDIQLKMPNATPVRKGDVLLGTFYFRTERTREESGEGQTDFVFELGRDPWTKSITYSVRAGREWRKIYVPFVAEEDYAAGEAQVAFRLGFQPQTIEIGGLAVENFGATHPLASLPVTPITYRGMEPDAPWRAAAAERIERIRKAGLIVRVEDESGKPVPGAEVRLELVRHQFGFGTCVAANRIVEGGEENEEYRQKLTELFNFATIENHLKWAPMAGDWGPKFPLETGLRAVDWLRDHGLSVRGHVLVWPGWRNLPRALREKEHDPGALRQEMADHIQKLTGELKGKLAQWDVVNEPFDNHDLLDILGNDAMVDWFKTARAADPGPKLFINDYAILSGGGRNSPHRDHYDATIQLLIDRGAPFDGIGMQGHFGTTLTAPDDMLAILDRFARFKKSIFVTEYDVIVDDEKVAAQFTRDFYTLMFSHPGVGGIVMWGFWDGAQWKRNAPLFRADWSLKPAGEAYRELVFKTWHTDEKGTTGQDGAFSARGFLGDYQLNVTHGNRTRSAKATLAAGGSTVTVRLD